MSTLNSILPAPFWKAHTPHNTTQITDFGGRKIFCRGIMATTTEGVITVRAKGDRINPDDTPIDYALTDLAVAIYLPLGIIVPVEFDLVKSTGAVAEGIVVFWG